MIDKVFCVSRMDYFETVFYNMITGLSDGHNVSQETAIDSFIEDCIAAEIITREHLYYPKRSS